MIEQNIFNLNNQPELYIMLEHLIKTKEVLTIEPYYEHGSVGAIGIFVNDAKTLYIALQLEFSRSDNQNQMIITYKDDTGNNETIIADSIQDIGAVDSFKANIKYANTIFSYIVSAVSADDYSFIGFKIKIA